MNALAAYDEKAKEWVIVAWDRRICSAVNEIVARLTALEMNRYLS